MTRPSPRRDSRGWGCARLGALASGVAGRAPPPSQTPRRAARFTLAGRLGDALINTAPDADVVEKFEQAGGEGKPRHRLVPVCYSDDEKKAKEQAAELWPNLALQGELSRELARPKDFEDAAAMVTPDDVAETVPCGPDADRHREAIRRRRGHPACRNPPYWSPSRLRASSTAFCRCSVSASDASTRRSSSGMICRSYASFVPSTQRCARSNCFSTSVGGQRKTTAAHCAA